MLIIAKLIALYLLDNKVGYTVLISWNILLDLADFYIVFSND